MIHPNASGGKRSAADNATVRSVFIIGPDKKVKAMLVYPMSAGRKFDEVLRQLGPDIQWLESYVTDGKTFCVYLASGEDIIRKHAEISGFPATKITEVRKMIDPTTERPD